MTSRCHGCGAEVIWIRTKAEHRKMPVDAEPVWILTGGRDSFVKKDGNIIF